ncbi:proto-oncogene tyrosine-protein kinase receptor Ret [Scaptodrosophila lebanonensis]|uniref:Proto-oncogene tyrosine-protein kinase receptor Ret n=1 Tax=Drosophila lebanonensis TaxID=7225 RepID=A0A6J2TWM5_DROLE|nr:proto-oncogene tyrosine-protein kinase receptor Ret [Scaptodrosophila lebanonensis]
MTFSIITVILVAIIVGTSVRLERNSCLAFDVYFPTTSVKFKLPLNEESESIFSKIPLACVHVLTVADNAVAKDYIYSLEENQLLRINGSSGEVYMRTDYKPLNQSAKYVITAFPRNQDTDGELMQVAHLTLELEPQSLPDYCAELEHICFWSSAHYTIAESDRVNGMPFQPVLIGALNSRAAKYLCPHMEVKYALTTGSSYFALKQNLLYTKQPLDHDEFNGIFAHGGQLQTRISCKVRLSTQEQREFVRTYNVTLLDRNDNGPQLQEKGAQLNFYLDQPYFKEHEAVGEKIIYLDKDTMVANGHLTYAIYNDSKGLVQPDCSAYEADHTGRPHTIVSCQLRFSRNGILRETPYCFTLEASDKTIDRRANATNKATAYICLHVDVEKVHEADQLPVALALRARKQSRIFDSVSETMHTEGGGMQPIGIDYEKDVFVHRAAAAFYRVAQPESFLDLLRMRSVQFGIEEDRSGAFGITTVGGIVYVKDPLALEHAPETVYFLNVTWQDMQTRAFVINIHLVEGRPLNASCELKIKSRTQTCAQVKYQSQCGKFCGLATNGGGCAWRGSSLAMFGRNYGSCVPDVRYCPDHVCDALEQLNPYACPQDCTPADRIVGPHTSNENKRGILSGSGTCICEDNGKCSCAPLAEEKLKRTRKRKNETNMELENGVLAGSLLPTLSADPQNDVLSVVTVAGFECDKSCILIAISCPVIFLVLVLCLLFTRRNMLHRGLGKQSQTPASKKVLPPDADACDTKNGDLPLMPLEGGFKFESNDTKWEFPRAHLELDTVLGEGEFGKVVKGYATEIAGLSGVTTVAVKMLKKGANSVEYMALLSEFQLLQEVSHPNVIKLLGACTQTETPLLIIEYARHGSLRSYLRLSRKIECAGVDFTDGVEPVTAKDMLTFAWQICKGMAYLTEIKLVHRDLAARNVLLADGKICKISDFGLTRDVYEDDAYLKRSRDRVPVKWMAPESLADHVYTTKSDVWAFGVLCWELITLGASPYPGIPPQNLYHLLKTGYRMERPENCSDAIYSIVRTCWTDEPNTRPSFKYLASEFEKLLGNNAKYIELETNAVSNPVYCGDEAALMPNGYSQELGEPDSLDHLWCPPKITYDTHDLSYSRTQSTTFGSEFQPPPGYDLPRPLIEAKTTEQILRYENDLRFPLNIRKSSCTPSYSNMTSGSALPHYAVPVKRGRSYLDMANNTLIPDNLDNRDFEKHLSKTISFRFSSLLNLKEPEHSHEQRQAEDAV